MVKHLILCDCLGSQSINTQAIEKGTGLRCSLVHTALCTHQNASAAKAMKAGNALFACTQERERFTEMAEALELAPPKFVDIRDRAGWSDDANRAGPKMAALISEGLLSAPQAKSLDIHSYGRCLILGPSTVVLPVAQRLAETLAVTVLVDAGDNFDLPLSRAFDVITGRLRSSTGSLGAFKLKIDALRQIEPGGRGAFRLSPPKDGGQSECDLVLDLRGGAPLFPVPEKRDGYLRADQAIRRE